MDNEDLIKLYENKLLELKQPDNILGLAKSGCFPNYTVYLITNDVDDKVYVGITNNVYKRMKDHFTLKNHIKESSKELYRHMVHLGVNHFNISIYQTDIKTKQLAEQLETVLIMIYKKQGKSLNGSMSRHTYHTRYLYKNYTCTNNNHNESLQHDETDNLLAQYFFNYSKNERRYYYGSIGLISKDEPYFLRFIKDYVYMIHYDNEIPYNSYFDDTKILFIMYAHMWSYFQNYLPPYETIQDYFKRLSLKKYECETWCFEHEYYNLNDNAKEHINLSRWKLIVNNDEMFQTVYQSLNRKDKMRLTKFKERMMYNG